MELISNVFNKIKSKTVYESIPLQVLDIHGILAINQKDVVVCIPYLTESNTVLLRYENVTAFVFVKPEINKYVVAMTTTIETTPEDALKKGLVENFGIVLDEKKKLEILQPIFMGKNNTAKYHICILPLMSYDYEQIHTSDVTAMEMKDNNLLVNSNELNNYIIYDLITRYCIDLFKKEYSLF